MIHYAGLSYGRKVINDACLRCVWQDNDSQKWYLSDRHGMLLLTVDKRDRGHARKCSRTALGLSVHVCDASLVRGTTKLIIVTT
jgi:hypothetical protein